MSISALSGSGTDAVSNLLQTLNANNSSSSSKLSAATGSMDTTQTSDIAQFFGKLSGMAANNPVQFKDLTSKIATELKAAAGNTTGKEADFLNNLADKFQTASTSGSAQGLHPHPKLHHLHHAYKEAAQDQTSSSDDLESVLNGGSASAPVQQAVQTVFNQVAAA